MVLDWKYMTVLNEGKMNGNEHNYQQRVWEKVYIKYLRLLKINQIMNLPNLGESGSGLSNFITEPNCFQKSPYYQQMPKRLG